MAFNYKDYSVLAGNYVAFNSGTSVLTGYFGSHNPYTGSGTINGAIFTGSDLDDALLSAGADYSVYISLTGSTSYSQSDIGGLIFTPGITNFTSTGTITIGTILGNNNITFDGDGYYYMLLPNAGLSTSTSLANVNMNLINGAKSSKIIWFVSGAINFQANTNSVGTLISQGNITMGTGSKNTCTIVSISGIITLNNNHIWSTTLRETRDVSTDGYVNIESTLADNESITINASNNFGGVLIKSGTGGIEIDSTNSININGGAASSINTSNGNITLNSVVGLVDIDGGSGINIGSITNGTSTINIGTSTGAKQINIGNTNVSSNMVLYSGQISMESYGTGNTSMQLYSNGGIDVNSINKININSAGTSSDAIRLYSAGGLDVDTVGDINFASGSGTSGSITLDSTFNNGGIVLSSGNQGIIISSNGGYIAMGSFSGGTIYIGTAAIARAIQIGNTTGNTSLSISSGTGGITIGNDTSSGEIQIGNIASNKTITVGNNNGSSRLIMRNGTGGNIKSQIAHVTLADANVTVTTSDLLTGILYMTTASSRTVTLPTASNIISAIPSIQVNDCIDFSLIYNITNALLGGALTLAMGTGGTMYGQNNISGLATIGSLFYGSLSGSFRLRITNVSTPAYNVYRLS